MIQFNSTRAPAMGPTASSGTTREAARSSLVIGLTTAILAEARSRSASGPRRLGILAMAAVPDVAVTLDEIAVNPDRAFDLRPERARVLLARAAAAQASLLARLSLDGRP
jgi:hypothetical protein